MYAIIQFFLAASALATVNTHTFAEAGSIRGASTSPTQAPTSGDDETQTSSPTLAPNNEGTIEATEVNTISPTMAPISQEEFEADEYDTFSPTFAPSSNNDENDEYDTLSPTLAPTSDEYDTLSPTFAPSSNNNDFEDDEYDTLSPTSAPTSDDDETCPDAPLDANCIFMSPPQFVVCGSEDCQYSSLCWAEAAGFDADECTEMVYDWEDDEEEEDTCPGASLDADCIFMSPPQFVLCGADDCQYSSLCWAQSAGFDADECTEMVYDWDDDDDEEEEDTCPEASLDADCIFMSPPQFVLCGADDCQYSSLCWAQAAGFDESECTAMCPQAETDMDGDKDFVDACPDVYDPVECGDNYCRYFNMCEAELVGFSVSECKATTQQ